ASEAQLDFPIVYTSATLRTATLKLEQPGTDVAPLFDTIVKRIPPPVVKPDDSLQILVLALAFDTYKGKMGIGKIHAGSLKRQQPIMRMTPAGERITGNASAVLAYQGLERVEIDSAISGDIVAVCGFDEVG